MSCTWVIRSLLFAARNTTNLSESTSAVDPTAYFAIYFRALRSLCGVSRLLRQRSMTLALLPTVFFATAVLAEPYLAPRNTEVPFPYLRGGTRTWPILTQPLPKTVRVELAAYKEHPDGTCSPMAQGKTLAFPGLNVSITPDGKLSIAAGAAQTQSSQQQHTRT